MAERELVAGDAFAYLEHTLALQRDVAERILLSAMRERDAADVAEVARRGASFLANEGRRLADSLDEETTLHAMSSMSLPCLGSWSIVDIIDASQTMRRLAIVHHDPAKQDLIRELDGRWSPEVEDTFGLPAMLRKPETTLIADVFDQALLGTSRDPETIRILHELGVGPLLTVPLIIRERLAGAVTFVGRNGKSFTPLEIELAEDLTARSAKALDRARLYGDAVAQKKEAELANLTKSAFLGSMSHEFRTPLSAIGGYLELIELGFRGPVTEQQLIALGRIRASQLLLAGLVEDLLNFTKLDSGQLHFDISTVVVRDAIAAGVALVEPLMSQKQLVHDVVTCDDSVVVRADADKLSQILLNLLSNAIKFTASGGRVSVKCQFTDSVVLIRVSDTGVGIPPHMQESIFDPFVQVKSGLAGPDRGVGLGLSISRGLARGMQGDLTVESTVGKGTRFTLSLPRAASGSSRTH